MHNTSIKYIKAHVFMCLLVLISFSCKHNKSKEYTRVHTAEEVSVLTKYYKAHLTASIEALDSLKDTFSKSLYERARNEFKLVEPILAFTDKDNYKSLNAPNILKIEEEDVTNIKIKKPFGFQVIEELLFEERIDSLYLKEIITKTQNRLQLIHNNAKLHLKEYHILWLLRDQIARTALTGITGFDSPILEQSLQEAKTNYSTLNFIINTYKSKFNNKELLNSWLKEIKETKTILTGDFNDFDRYTFIQKHSHKQLQLLKETSSDWKVEYPLTMAFNNDMTSFFSKETFNLDFFSDYHFDKNNYKEKLTLGKKLFNDASLSKNERMSCATCHIKDKAFTDGLKTFPNQVRNTPTLPYVAYQKAFFYDARAGSLEGQIVGVVENKNEFHSNMKVLTQKVSTDSIYQNEFKTTYGKVSDLNIRNAIAIYMRSLGEFNSKFDKNINEVVHTISKSEINGFNLFMGKAKCATCHFPPVFNGTVPPNFKESELESIGVPNTVNEKELDTDLGRYHVFKTKERNHFFKTPTIRNIAKTAPYMHNGVYNDLQSVMSFYNEGGGEGLNYEVKGQTLPADKLILSVKEINDLIAFMESLSDE